MKYIRSLAGMVVAFMVGSSFTVFGADAAPGSLPVIQTPHGTYKLGKKPYPPGTRAQWIKEGRVLGAAPAGYFPRSATGKGAADNRGFLPPIGDQGSEGSCVHWAGAYHTKTANMKRQNPALNITASSNQCSPRFTYNLTNGGEDNGGWGHEPFEIFMRFGGASLRQKPYTAGQYTTLPVAADFIEGLHRRTTNYVWVWDWDPSAAEIAELKAFLDAGGVAACGVYAEDTFSSWSAGSAPWTGPSCTYEDINHMVTVCGYTTGYYWVANSWGTSYGDNGFIKVNSTYFENYFSDVMFPLEGAYTPATDYVKFNIRHGRRSDIHSLAFSVNGTTVWSNHPLPMSYPKDTGEYTTDTRANWDMVVDLTAAPWGGANTVIARVMDNVAGTAGSISNMTLYYEGLNYVSTNPPVAIPDSTGVPAYAQVSTLIETSAPVFNALSSQTATAGVALAFTVSAGGYPVPVLALQGQTASSGYSFTPGTGLLTYTPPEADIGEQSFTFTAGNVAGVATQTVNVTVRTAPPAAPAAVWASATNTTDFTAAWSAVLNATSYRLDVSTSATFSASGGASGTLLDEGFDGGITPPAGWTFTAIGAIYNTAGNYGRASPSLKLDATADRVQTPALSGPTNVSFWIKGNGTDSSSVLLLEVESGSAWSTLTTVSPLPTVGTTYAFPLSSSVTGLRFTYNKSAGNLAFDDVQVSGAGEVPNYLAGYSNLVVASTSQLVSGLTLGKTYYFRVRADGPGGSSGNSTVASVTTLNVPTAPSFSAIPGQSASLGRLFTLNVAAYAAGYPAPDISVGSSTAGGSDYSLVDGTLAYTPSATGAFTFVFLASNNVGMASATTTVAVVEHTGANYGLFVGLNQYDSSYIPSDNWLSGCVPDANHIYTNAIKRGEWTTLTVTRMLDSAGKKAAIRSAFSNYAATAAAGDVFFYYHSSHGGQNSGMSVYLCTYDDDYQDTELAADLALFATGVKVVVMVDACHSGGLFKSARAGTRATAAEAGAGWDLAGNVTRIMTENRRAALARGAQGTDRLIAPSEIGWITAADYNQYSWDGEDGGLFTSKLIEGWTNNPPNSCDVNADAYADFYELYDYSWDVANNADYEYTTAMAHNTNVLLATIAGWVGDTPPGGLVMFSNMVAQTVVVGHTLAYPVGAYTAGTHDPVTVWMSTVQYGASYADGVLTFTPVADGTYSFNFMATNTSGGSASASLTVTATLAAPELSPATSIGNDRFTMNWSAVTGAASYRLDVATASSFSSGGSGATTVLVSTIDSGLSTGWEYVNGAVNAGTYHKLVSATDPGVISAVFSTVGFTNAVAGFSVATYGGATANKLVISYSLDAGSSWTVIGTNASATTTTYVSGLMNLPAAVLGQHGLRVKWHNPGATASVGLRLQKLAINGSQAAGESSLVVSDRSVVGTSHEVADLDMNTRYYYRVKAVANTIGPHSTTGTVMTTAEDTPPAFSPIPDQAATLSALFTLNLSGYVSGYPPPVLSLLSSTASGTDYSFAGDTLSFTPSVTGTFAFVFQATNTLGSASATAQVAVASGPVTIPVASIANIASNSFTVNWTACTGATNYQVQVATDSFFTARATPKGVILSEDFATLTDTTPPAGWTSSKASDLDYVTALYCGVAVPAYKFGTAGQSLLSPAFATGATNLQFFSYGNGGSGSIITISGLVSGVWTLIDTKTISSNGATYRTAVNSQTTQLRFSFSKVVNCSLDDVILSGSDGGGGGSVVFDQVVSGLTRDVPDLTPETWYYARVRMTQGGWSDVVSARTTGGGAAPNYTDWAQGQGLNPAEPNGQPGANYDSDADSNYEEYVADTDPTDPNSSYPYYVTNFPGTGVITIWAGPPTTNSRIYDVWVATNLMPPQAWTGFNFDRRGADDGSAIGFSVTNTGAGRYYRTGVKVPDSARRLRPAGW